MKKYFYIFKLGGLKSLNYRFDTFVNLFFSNLNLLILILFWRTVYGGDDVEIGGFSKNGIVTYFILIELLKTINCSSSGFYINDLVKNGQLNQELLKPISINTMSYFKSMSVNAQELLMQSLFTLCLLPFIMRMVSFDVSFDMVGILLLFLALASITSHLFWSILGYLSFYFEEATAILWSFMVIVNFLSGYFLPIDFFPGWLERVILYTPIATWGYLPVKIYLGNISMIESAVLLLVNGIWVVILLIVGRYIWKKSVMHYTSVGG